MSGLVMRRMRIRMSWHRRVGIHGSSMNTLYISTLIIFRRFDTCSLSSGGLSLCSSSFRSLSLCCLGKCRLPGQFEFCSSSIALARRLFFMQFVRCLIFLSTLALFSSYESIFIFNGLFDVPRPGHGRGFPTQRQERHLVGLATHSATLILRRVPCTPPPCPTPVQR